MERKSGKSFQTLNNITNDYVSEELNIQATFGDVKHVGASVSGWIKSSQQRSIFSVYIDAQNVFKHHTCSYM